MESDQSDRRRRCQRRFQRHHGDIITFLNAADDDESHAISDQSYRIVVIITILDLDQTGRGGSDG